MLAARQLKGIDPRNVTDVKRERTQKGDYRDIHNQEASEGSDEEYRVTGDGEDGVSDGVAELEDGEIPGGASGRIRIRGAAGTAHAHIVSPCSACLTIP